ncbi:hypothetical protein THAOC_06517 [Thalassiosira oceanica]|uniref:Major facilitator superfamily (MFS) profile domain-containing protein n=1 Tax=Thalassiosira oceanica TaxID=159749 RepID=K0T027_THAOC|nr:hypothetical protein THAOC_06517 [Thalassiosira oceanica]|eukprot:EJK71993.1 hypothetical protein THAOC_06517 [Thalassiosira oceanica]
MCQPDTYQESKLLAGRNLPDAVLRTGTYKSCVSLFLLITGLSLTFPHMQSRRDALGCDSYCYGSLTSVRSGLSLVGTALMGRLSDSNTSILARSIGSAGKDTRPSGRRACLYIGTVATIFGLVIAISVDSLQGLWLSMIPSALTWKTGTTNQAKRIDNQSRRSGSVGKLGMCAGLSFMVGPMVAAVLSPSFKVACIGAAVLTTISGIVLFNLPMPLRSARRKSEGAAGDDMGQTQAKQSTEFTLPKMMKLQTPKSRAAAVLLVTRLMMALAFHIFNTIWPASLKSRFAFGPQDHAKFMSFVGVSYAFSQGVVAKFLVKAWGRRGKVELFTMGLLHNLRNNIRLVGVFTLCANGRDTSIFA